MALLFVCRQCAAVAVTTVAIRFSLFGLCAVPSSIEVVLVCIRQRDFFLVALLCHGRVSPNLGSFARHHPVVLHKSFVPGIVDDFSHVFRTCVPVGEVDEVRVACLAFPLSVSGMG